MKLYLRIANYVLKFFEGAATVCLAFLALITMLSVVDHVALGVRSLLLDLGTAILGIAMISFLEGIGDTAWQIFYGEWQFGSTLQNDSSAESEEFYQSLSNKKMNLCFKILGAVALLAYAYGYCPRTASWTFAITVGLIVAAGVWLLFSCSLLIPAYRLYTANKALGEAGKERYEAICHREGQKRVKAGLAADKLHHDDDELGY